MTSKEIINLSNEIIKKNNLTETDEIKNALYSAIIESTLTEALENENLKKQIEEMRRINELKYKEYEKRLSDNATIICKMHKENEKLKTLLKNK